MSCHNFIIQFILSSSEKTLKSYMSSNTGVHVDCVMIEKYSHMLTDQVRNTTTELVA